MTYENTETDPLIADLAEETAAFNEKGNDIKDATQHDADRRREQLEALIEANRTDEPVAKTKAGERVEAAAAEEKTALEELGDVVKKVTEYDDEQTMTRAAALTRKLPND